MVQNGKRQQRAVSKRKAEQLGEFMNDDSTPEQVGHMKLDTAEKAKHKADQQTSDQISALLMHTADRAKKQATLAAAEVRKQQRTAAKPTTGKENGVAASVRVQPQPPRVGAHREPLDELERHPNLAATKVVADDSVRTIVETGDLVVSPTPSATNSSASGSGLLYGRKAAPNRNAELLSNLARDHLCGVANQLVDNKTINPIIPMNKQPQAFALFRDALCLQFAMFENEDGGTLKIWLRKWLVSQRAQAKIRKRVKNGNVVELQVRHQEDLALYKAQMAAKQGPVLKLTLGAPESTGNGGPSSVAGAQATTDAPETQVQSMRTNQISPCVLTEEEVDHVVPGDFCLLARRDLTDDGKCKGTFKAAITSVAVGSSSLT